MTKDNIVRVMASAVEVLEASDTVDAVEVALMCQYLLTAYLTTVPDISKGEMQVLELLHGLLPTGTGLPE